VGVVWAGYGSFLAAREETDGLLKQSSNILLIYDSETWNKFDLDLLISPQQSLCDSEA
jgi:hypothetical protein